MIDRPIALNPLTLSWPLTSRSVVVEVGGYEGEWAAQMVERYGCRLYVFEPQWWAYEKCLRRLAGSDAQVFHYGLGDDASQGGPMYSFGNDGATFLGGRNAVADGHGDLRDAVTVFEHLDLAHIDLMQVNAEGYEFVLLPHLMKAGWLERIDYLTVQFHLADVSSEQYLGLRARIEETHDLIWDDTQGAWARKGV